MLKLATAGLETENPSIWETRRLWSLWDMINCSIFALGHLLTKLMAAEGEYRQLATFADAARANPGLAAKAAELGAPSIYVADKEKQTIKGLLQFALHLADQLSLEATRHRIDMFDLRLGQQITLNDFASELRVLREAIEGEIQFHYFFHYSKQKALLLLRVQGDWAPTLAAFESAKKDIEEAVDCYASEHETACAYHLMRVLEHGLRALAINVGRVFDKQNWGNIIEEIESSIEAERDSLPKGSTKDDRLTFLSVAAKEFFYFKDGWRNHTAHNRVTYDEPMARGLLDHVRTFMNHLSTRLSEKA